MTRVDALRNRARVVEAATAVFAEQGVDAGVDVVASRAGVGKATVYRSFPTKEHLVAAVAVQRLTWFAERAEAAAGEPDALAAFEDLMLALAEAQAGDRVLGGSLATAVGELPDFVAARDRAQAALGRVMERACAAGGLQPDATADEVRVLFTGVCRVLGEEGEHDPAVWRRYARLIVAALSS